MARSTGVGLEALAAAFNEAEDALADTSPEPASSGASDHGAAAASEQPAAVEPEVEEHVGLLSILEENLDEEEDEHRRDDDSPNHLVNGEYLTTQELINGYLRQSDYTKKTQELASERDRLRAAETLYNAIQDDPVGTIRLLAQRFNTGVPMLNPTVSQPSTQAGVDIDALVEQKVQELLGTDPRIKEAEAISRAQAEEAAFSAIEAEYSVKLTRQDREIVRQKAKELGIDNLKFVFQGLMQEAQLRQARKDQLRKSSTAQGRRSDEGDSTPSEKKDYSDFWEAAKETLAELGLELN